MAIGDVPPWLQTILRAAGANTDPWLEADSDSGGFSRLPGFFKFQLKKAGESDEWVTNTGDGTEFASIPSFFRGILREAGSDSLSWLPPSIPPVVGDYFRDNPTNITISTIDTSEAYDLDTDELAVFRNGLRILETVSLGSPIDRFTETTATRITLGVLSAASDAYALIFDDESGQTGGFSVITSFGGTALTVPTYTLGTGELRIWRNGVLMVKSTNIEGIGDAVDRYVENTTTSVTLEVAAVASDIFVAEVLNVAPVFSETQTTVAGSVVTTTNGVTSLDEKLIVYRNGLIMYEGSPGGFVDRYTISGPNSISLSTAAVASDWFTIIKRT